MGQRGGTYTERKERRVGLKRSAGCYAHLLVTAHFLSKEGPEDLS